MLHTDYPKLAGYAMGSIRTLKHQVELAMKDGELDKTYGEGMLRTIQSAIDYEAELENEA